jgi:hypothetical protein
VLNQLFLIDPAAMKWIWWSDTRSDSKRIFFVARMLFVSVDEDGSYGYFFRPKRLRFLLLLARDGDGDAAALSVIALQSDAFSGSPP